MNQKHCDYELFCRFFPSYSEEHKTVCTHGSGCQYDSRSHPYQSERDKVLDEIDKWIKHIVDTRTANEFYIVHLGEIKRLVESLRQAGEP
jgi:hypothetical protein